MTPSPEQKVARRRRRRSQGKLIKLRNAERIAEAKHRLLLVGRQTAARRKQTFVVGPVQKPCTKLRHPSPEGAEKHKAKLEERGWRGLAIYFCKRCRAWHVGNQKKGHSLAEMYSETGES